ncbi:MAG: acylphosphatase [Burkholderiales bacterium]|nr:acylphosphatase [Phycisphaerae bacterium]
MSQVATECCRRHCYFKGRVQGVGFRYTARNLAINYDVSGFIRNLPDGRVELVAEGPGTEVVNFVEAICDRMKGHIQHVDQDEEPVSGQYGHFVIAR